MTKKIRLLERSANDAGDFGIEKISFSWELRKCFVSFIRPESVAGRQGIRVGDVLSSSNIREQTSDLKEIFE